jgi:Uma2 family endonuclease
MAVVSSLLMTVEEFRKLPEDAADVYHELRHGEVVAVTRPKLKHHLLQDRLVEFLKPVARPAGHVSMEFPFRPLPEYELRVADVAYVSRDRLSSTSQDDYLQGAPELVIEVLSPSNSATELYDKEILCLQNGAQQFWIVDPDRRQVKVATPDGVTITYQSGQQIPLALWGDAMLPVDEIFA